MQDRGITATTDVRITAADFTDAVTTDEAGIVTAIDAPTDEASSAADMKDEATRDMDTLAADTQVVATNRTETGSAVIAAEVSTVVENLAVAADSTVAAVDMVVVAGTVVVAAAN